MNNMEAKLVRAELCSAQKSLWELDAKTDWSEADTLAYERLTSYVEDLTESVKQR